MPMIFTLTKAGRAALLNDEQTGTAAHTVVSAGITATAFTASEDMTALPDEIKRIDAVSGSVLEADLITLVIRDITSDTYTMRGFGLYLDNGTLLGVYGQADPIMEKSTVSTLLLQADLRIMDASLTAENITFGNQEFINPPATETVEGIARIATQKETEEGADDNTIITPKKLKTSMAKNIVIATSENIKNGVEGKLVDAAGLEEAGITAEAIGTVDGKKGGVLEPDTHLSVIAKNYGTTPGQTNESPSFAVKIRDGHFGGIYYNEIYGGGARVIIGVHYAGAATVYQFGYNGVATAPVSWSTTSDRRIKKDVKVIDNAVEKLSKIRGCTFTKHGTPLAGVIAQDVEAVLPQAVTIVPTDDFADLKCVDALGILGLCIAAVNELSEKVKELESKIV